MAQFSRFLALVSCFAAVQLVSGGAAAHIELLDPPARYVDARAGNNKNCPCGEGTGLRQCTVPEERSDPNRSAERATSLMGGSALMVEVAEYIGHSGRMRVAFDPDGADLGDFNQHVLIDVPDPAGNRGNSGDGSRWEFGVALPNIDCDNCTLQVIQMMNGEMENPVDDPVGKSTYYACADLTLTRDTSKPEGYAEPMIVLGEPMEMASTGAPSEMPAVPAMMGGTTATPSPMSTSTPGAAMMDPVAGKSGGCSLTPARGQQTAPIGLAVAALLGVLRCRSSRRRSLLRRRALTFRRGARRTRRAASTRRRWQPRRCSSRRCR